jgi:acetyl esterase/lipase
MTILPRPTTVLEIIGNSCKPLAWFALFTASFLTERTVAQTTSQAPADQTPANAPAADRMTAIPIPPQPDAVELGTGPLPNATVPESWHSQYGSMFARNVSVATLTPFMPDPSKATGAAVIVAPGGGFRTLSMENEGWNVARALADQGIAAFVLKYRLNQTPADLETFARPPAASPAPGATAATPTNTAGGAPPATRPSPADMAARIAPQIADANAAFALVRANAAKSHVDPDRVGMIGFSAGAMLTMATTLNSSEAKPAFIGNIYGPLSAVNVPAGAPPLFIALAADDPLFGGANFGLIESWHQAKKPVEFHYYEQGGHGFGMYPKTTTSTGWFDAYVKWLAMHGYLKPKN